MIVREQYDNSLIDNQSPNCRDFLISIVISTYNRDALLPRAINSVLNQTYSNLELIVIDDGSTDNTAFFIKSINDKRIRYFKHEKNKGEIAAKIAGFNSAKGDYIALLDDDDELVINAVEIAVEHLRNLSSSNVKIAIFNCINMEKNKLSGSNYMSEGFVSFKDWLCGRFSGNYWLIVERKALKDVLKESNGLENRFSYGLAILWLKLLFKVKGYYIPTVLYKAYVGHGNQRISEFKNRVKHTHKVVSTHKTFLDEFGQEALNICPKKYGDMLFNLGFWQILDGDRSGGQRNLIKSFKIRITLAPLIYFLLSIFLNKNQMRFVVSECLKLVSIIL